MKAKLASDVTKSIDQIIECNVWYLRQRGNTRDGDGDKESVRFELRGRSKNVSNPSLRTGHDSRTGQLMNKGSIIKTENEDTTSYLTISI